jgi:radical SAM protein with 4Fe4S-binding SPASM domain
MNPWLKRGLQRLKHEALEALFINSGVDLTKPLVIRAKPTERCNYQCGSCRCWRLPRYPVEMSLIDWQRVLGQLRDFVGRNTVQFAGGEPFVYRSFVELVEWCATHDIEWGVTTNGSAFTEGVVRRVIAARPNNVNVSVDGASSAVHDASRGVAGSLVRVRRGIETLCRERRAAGAAFPVRIKPTVHRQNFREMPDLVEWAVEVGATSIDFAPVREWSEETRTDLWVRPIDEPALQAVVEALCVAKAQGAPIETEVSAMRSWVAHFRREQVLPTVAPCRVGMRDFHIEPDGVVHACWYYAPIGNVQQQPPAKIWRGRTARDQRRVMLQCDKFGSGLCASSCLSHRTLSQDWQRIKLFRRPKVTA